MGEWIKKIRILKAALKIIKDPRDINNIAELTDLLANAEAFSEVFSHLNQNPATRQVLETAPLMKKITLAELEQFEAGTLGHEYYQFLVENKLDIELIPVEPSNPMNYVRYRVRKYHDIWHVICGYDTSVEDELALQVFTFLQLRTSLSIILVALGLLHFVIYERQNLSKALERLVDGWKKGQMAKPLFAVKWEDYFNVPVSGIQKQVFSNVKELDFSEYSKPFVDVAQ